MATVAIKQLFIGSVGAHHTQEHRAFASNLTKAQRESLVRNVRGGDSASISNINKSVTLVDLEAETTGEVLIEGGDWNSPRSVVYLIAEVTDNEMQSHPNHRISLSGYSDKPLMPTTATTGRISYNMSASLIFNTVTLEQWVENVMHPEGGYWRVMTTDAVLVPTSILSDNDDYLPGRDVHYGRPCDVFTRASTNSGSSQNTHTLYAVQSMDGLVYSRTDNDSHVRFTQRVINALVAVADEQVATGGNAEASQFRATTNINFDWGACADKSVETTRYSSSATTTGHTFLDSLGAVMEMQQGAFQLSTLIKSFPELENNDLIIPLTDDSSADFTSEDAVHYSDMNNGAPETLVAARIKTMLPPIMADCRILHVGFTMTNMTMADIDGSPYSVVLDSDSGRGMGSFEIAFAPGTAECELLRLQALFLRRIREEVCPLIKNSFNITAKVTLLKNSIVRVSLGGRPSINYATPSFASSKLSAVRSNGANTLTGCADNTAKLQAGMFDYRRANNTAQGAISALTVSDGDDQAPTTTTSETEPTEVNPFESQDLSGFEY